MTSPLATLACPSETARRWAVLRAPRIVAESLMAVADPVRTGLVAAPPASGGQVARALARSLVPPERGGPAVSWLLPGQARSVRRALAALERFGGALLADPVGSGKTYVALGVATLLARGRSTACIVPAPLAPQWRAVAERLGVAVEVGTHQQASRGRLPMRRTGLAIIDESHHFRNPRTRRYAHVAPWLVGRPVLLLSATPIVNRLADLAHQLLLGIRDDALLADGVVSIRAALSEHAVPPALGRLVFEETSQAGPRPARNPSVSVSDHHENAAAAAALASVDRLRLSNHPPTAALVRGVLHRALASSPAALAGALRRYRGLLRHAEDARRAGRALTRAELREFAGELDDQLVLWELCPGGDGRIELSLDDLATLDPVLADAAAAEQAEDGKVERLRAILADRRPTLIFTARRETVRHLRDRLAPPPVAWCTGERSGLGPFTVPRATVLGWFGARQEFEAADLAPPYCLIVTDVAAEGLDLKRAARVVHYDLPWTPMRLEQREGRAVRLGSGHEVVEVVRFVPPPAVEAALKLGERLMAKASLPARAGLGAEGMRVWRWRSALADRVGPGAIAHGTAVVRGEKTGALAGFELVAPMEGVAEVLGTAVGWIDLEGGWCEEEVVVSERLLEAARHDAIAEVRPEAVQRTLDRLTGHVRARLALVGGRRWTVAEPDSSVRRLTVRLGEAVRDAARRRDATALARLERALAFAAGGHTAGEALLVRRLAQATDPELIAAIARVPASSRRWTAVEVRLTGLVLFEAG